MSKKITYKLCVKSLPDGLLYLCYTAKEGKKFDSYMGSGKYWRSHIKAHNYNINDISTTIIFETDSMEELSKKGEFYSDVFGVETRERWANLTKELGQCGPKLLGDINPMKNPNTAKKISDGMIGSKNTNFGKTKEKSHLFGVTGGNHPKSIRVNQITLEGVLVNRFDSVTLASNNVGISSGNIVDVCKGKNKTAGGYKWEYATNEQVNSIA